MQLEQDSADKALLFLMVLDTDSKTGATGLTPTVTLSKNGAAFAAPAGAVSEVGHGWYKVAPHATDRDTRGGLALHAEAAGADDCDMLYEVVALVDLVEANLTVAQLMRGVAAVLLGKSSNGGLTFRDTGDTKNVIVGTVDGDGNRTAVARDLD